MPTWEQYKTPFDQLPREYKKRGMEWNGVRNYNTPEGREAFERILGFDVSVLNEDEQRDMSINQQEVVYHLLGKRVLFCETNTIGDMLHRSKLEGDFDTLWKSVSNLFITPDNDLQKILFNLFPNTPTKNPLALSISFPSTLIINGRNPEPVLISFNHGSLMIKSMTKYPKDLNSAQGYYNFLTVANQNQLEQILNDEVESSNIDDYCDKEEYLKFKEDAQLAIKLVIFSQSDIALTKEDVPEGMKHRDKRFFLNQSTSKGVSVREPVRTHASPNVHYRSGHFRTLSHERYKRDSKGNYQIVYVSHSIVGRAKTVKT